MIHVEAEYLKMILSILQKYPYTFYAFGSRVTGKHQKFSDLDICYMGSIPLSVLSKIQEDFEESNLPFKVDLVAYSSASKDFQNQINNNLIKIG